MAQDQAGALPTVLTADDPLAPEAIRAQVDRILGSPIFVQSRRLVRFLRFIVERAIEGNDRSFKEYVIGVEVFDRGPHFDPRVDPIVRVEARRLRAKLRQYYKSEGREDPILIAFSKGGYTPVFRERLRPRASRPNGKALFVSLGGWTGDLHAAVQQAIETRTPVPFGPDGAHGNAPASVMPMIDEAGRCVGAQLVVRFVPQEMMAQAIESLNTSNEELAAINAELSASLRRIEMEAATSQLVKAAEQSGSSEATFGSTLLSRHSLPRLAETNEFLEFVLNQLEVAVAVIDRQSRIVSWNRAAEQLWGVAVSDAQGQSFLELSPEFPTDELRARVRECLKDGRPVEVRLRAAKCGEVECRLLPAFQSPMGRRLPGAVILIMRAR